MNTFSDYVARRDIMNWLESNNLAVNEKNVAAIMETGFENFITDPTLAEALEPKETVEE